MRAIAWLALGLVGAALLLVALLLMPLVSAALWLEERTGPVALAALLALGASGCAGVRQAFVDAFHEDESTWSPAMRADRRACEEEVVEGRWRWLAPRGDGWTVGYGEALRACLRSRDWKLGAGGRLGP